MQPWAKHKEERGGAIEENYHFSSEETYFLVWVGVWIVALAALLPALG